MSKIEQIIGEIETYLDGCKPQAFSGSKKIVVEKDVIDEMLVELRMSTPEEIKRYQKIIANKDAIINDAQQKADTLISDAKNQAADLVSESEIMKQAYQQAQEVVDDAQDKAQEIVDNAVTDANAIRDSAMNYTDSALNNLQTIISHSLEDSQTRFNSFIEQMRSSYDVVTANRKELNAAVNGEDAPEESSDKAQTEEGGDFKIDLPLDNDKN